MDEETEDVCRAILRGEVDAFVVGDEKNQKVLLLANAYQRYRQVVERMQQGAITVTPEGSILYANQQFSQLLGIPLAQLYTEPLGAYAGIGDRARLGTFLMGSARNARLEIELHRRDGTGIPVRLSLATFTDGFATLLVTDLRPMQWPSIALDALDSIRDALEKLNAAAPAGAENREARERIGSEVNGLARMIDEMLDVREAKVG